MKKAKFWAIVALLCNTAICAAQAPTPSNAPATDTTKKKGSIGVAVKPVRIDFHLVKGETAYQPIYVTNNFSTTMQFKARFMDWMRDSTGGHTYAEPGTFPRSCAKWMSFNKDLIEIEPGKTGEFLVRMKVPDNDSAVQEMKWCLAFIESVAENKAYKPSDSSRAHVRAIMRVGIHILQTPPALADKKDVKMLSFTSVTGEKNKYRILAQNTGETQLECKSFIELRSLTTGSSITIPSIEFPLFPNQKRYMDFTLPDDLPKGKYTATGVVDAQEDDIALQASEATIEIK
ncbi:hypothetical protein [Taibaiella soli]|uniref:DUF916 domain-containing protein n=1 Tax=Taibaiella soli TaxID=1649169 RepID=A0A2W2B318_9BACT|nr:hypothetical protein [Taibaiella soli]PZF74684.1 hypothetical protein DN068_00355 [Taibaiella soli]